MSMEITFLTDDELSILVNVAHRCSWRVDIRSICPDRLSL